MAEARKWLSGRKPVNFNSLKTGKVSPDVPLPPSSVPNEEHLPSSNDAKPPLPESASKAMFSTLERKYNKKEKVQIVVSGGGSDDVNGLYKEIGVHNGTLYFESENKVLISREKIGGQTGWIIGKAPTAFYGIPSAEDLPPETGWKRYKGENPIPTLHVSESGSASATAAAVKLLNDPVNFGKVLETAGSNQSDDDAKARLHVYKEIIETEKAYVEDLKVLMDVYESPLKSAIDVNRPIISNLEISKIFGNIEILWRLHTELLQKLENGRKERLSEVIADSFLSMIPYFGSYVAYCNRYNEALQVAANLVTSNNKFKLFVQQAITNPQCRGNDLSSFLIKPVQRICKYPLFFVSLLKKMPNDHENYKKLQEASEAMTSMADKVNDRMKSAFQIAKVFEIYNNFNCEINIIEPQRRFLTSCTLSMSNNSIAKTNYTFFLFNDIILLAICPKKTFILQFRFNLTQVEVRTGPSIGTSNNKKDPIPDFALMITTSEGSTSNLFWIESDESEKAALITLLTKAIEEDRDKSGKKKEEKAGGTSRVRKFANLKQKTTLKKGEDTSEESKTLLDLENKYADRRSSTADDVSSYSTLKRGSVKVSDVTAFGTPGDEVSAHRLSVYNEIIDTERAYVADLEVIAKDFLAPLRKSQENEKPILPFDDIMAIFLNVEMLLAVNSELLEYIDKNRMTERLSKCISQAFVNQLPSFGVYTLWCTKYPEAVKRHNSCLEAYPSYADFIDTMKRHPRTKKQDLTSFLIKPIQRICKYPLFFKDLLKHTSLDHDFREDLEEALKATDLLALKVNDFMRKDEEKNKVFEIFQKLSGTDANDIFSPTRRVISNELSVVVFKNAETSNKTPLLLYVFNDLLLLIQKKSSIMGGEYFKLWGKLNLIDVQIASGGDELSLILLVGVTVDNGAAVQKYTIISENNIAKISLETNIKNALASIVQIDDDKKANSTGEVKKFAMARRDMSKTGSTLTHSSSKSMSFPHSSASAVGTMKLSAEKYGQARDSLTIDLLAQPIIMTDGKSFPLPTKEESKHRLFMYKEIIETEYKYIQDLNTMVDVFLKPLRRAVNITNSPIISSDDIMRLFGAIEDVLKINSKLLQLFNAGLSEKRLSILIGESFVSVSSDFEVYCAYCNQYDTAINLFGSLQASNTKFREFLEVQQRHPSCRMLDLGSFLIKPVQRICKYPLFFRDIVKQTPMEHPQRPLLLKALDAVNNIASKVNDYMNQSKTAAKMFEISKMCEEVEDLVTADRRFIMQTEVEMASETKERSKVHFFLFNDLILVLVHENKWMGTPSYKLSARFRIVDAGIREVPETTEDKEKAFVLMTASSQKGTTSVNKLIFWCQSSLVMQQLKKTFTDLREAMDTKIAGELSASAGTETGKRKFAGKTRAAARPSGGTGHLRQGTTELKDVEARYRSLKMPVESEHEEMMKEVEKL